MVNSNQTPWAAKYGAREGGKSKLTPVDSIFPINKSGLFIAEYQKLNKQNRRMEKFQQDNLYWFTTRELIDLDAISTRTLKSLDLLHNPIHPVFAKSRWERTPDHRFGRQPDSLYPIGKGYPGYWVADNDIVYNAIEPSLRLASRMLLSSHMLPWVRDTQPSSTEGAYMTV